ncbi:alpha/beta fold hydrolase [Geodermatophilus sp. DSM 45219]|uniref:alpha/beta fold hydrolase n=1 Tax=Geodermatophilus sp. DSM 45219 TaxID=1881103 RepID=UPI00088B6085|nr:alpha/beta fold hydrolase [Geodermatophilus sp. DSM 45219]SDO06693.1 Pimeloyl-ACP methyl ester carboxylesterase [Geodermatophilus sp. DSM 45219]
MTTTIEVPTRVGPVPVRTAGDGPAVLAVHGALVDGRLWDRTARLLAPHARVLLPDLPLGAHRRAVPSRSRLTPEEVAGALVDVLDGLDLDRAVLLGNDTGGALAQLIAAGAPERTAGLVLAGCDAFEHFPPPLLRPLPALAALPGTTALLVRALAVPALFADPGRLNVFTSRGFDRALVRDWLHPARTDPAVRADLTALVRAMRPEPLVAAAGRLPVLAGRAAVVWGRRDRVFPPRDAERLAALLGTTVTWLDDALTFVPNDRPDAVADAVRTVLAAADR